MKVSRIPLALILLLGATPLFAQQVPTKKAQVFVDGNKWYQRTSPGWQAFGPAGTWWRNPAYVSNLSLTADQQQKMDDVFQQSRIKLIDLTATLDKEEAILEPLMKADRLDEAKVAAQIDKVADARAELEKANARMLLGIRRVLTPEQWTKLNSTKNGLFGWPSGTNWDTPLKLKTKE